MIRSLITKYRQWDKSVKERRRFQLDSGRICINDQGFDVSGPKTRNGTVTWRLVFCINAFKRDLFSYDEICFEFHQDGSDLVVEVNEEMSGWEMLLEELPKRYAGFERDWFGKVAHPAFVPNFIELWKRVESGKTA